jgi:hypothetical protein
MILQEKTFEKPPVGSFAATFVGAIDRGIYTSEFYTNDDGTPKQTPKISLYWQLGKLDSRGEPFVVQRMFTRSITIPKKGTKPHLRTTLESWQAYRGGDIDFDALRGAGAMVTLIEGKGDYVNVGGVSPLPEGLSAPTLSPKVIEDFEKRKAETEAAVAANGGYAPKRDENAPKASVAGTTLASDTVVVENVDMPKDGQKSYNIKTDKGWFRTTSGPIAVAMENASGSVTVKFRESEFKGETYRWVQGVVLSDGTVVTA